MTSQQFRRAAIDRSVCVAIAWAKDPSAAQAFRAFVIGAEGQALLRGHGFAAPEE